MIAVRLFVPSAQPRRDSDIANKAGATGGYSVVWAKCSPKAVSSCWASMSIGTDACGVAEFSSALSPSRIAKAAGEF